MTARRQDTPAPCRRHRPAGEMPALERLLPLFLALVCSLLPAPGLSRAETAPAAVVLVLNSYHYGYSWSDNEMNGVFETFRAAPRHFELRTEYLDTKYFPRMELFEEQATLMARKYGESRIRLVIATDNPALDFALKYRDRLFPGAAIVFCGINGYEPSMIAGQHRITGVAERLNTPDTVSLALQLQPDTREIFVVHDYTSTGLATRHEAEADLQSFASRVRIRYMENLSTDAMLRQLKGLKKGTIVLALSYSRDKDGIVYDHTRIARLLGENSPVPVYGTHAERIGYGILGGSLLGGRMQGSGAAELALRFLGGEDIDRIPVTTKSATTMMFDYDVMEKFGISLSRLPKGAVVINEPQSFYHKHKRLVWTTLSAMGALVLIIVLLAVNISQRRRSERAIAQKAAELERTNLELQEFNVLAYHNLQEPLRTIGGFVQLLSRKYRGRLDQEADEYIGFVVQGVSRMKELFNDFLAYSQLARDEAKMTDVDLNAVLATVLAVLKEPIADSGARIEGDQLPTVTGNPRQMELLLRHLVENAIKFRGGDRPLIRVAAAADDGAQRISVHDNGIGIDPSYHERIFRIFSRLNPQESYPGTGIGLAICRKITALHGGRIWVESPGGDGTTFHFTLKRATVTATKR